MVCSYYHQFLENGLPVKGKVTPLDPTNDFFRARLCCTLLDTCGMYFDKGNAKLKLDAFLKFFQVFIKFTLISALFTFKKYHSNGY